jgi:hypothetical protein
VEGELSARVTRLARSTCEATVTLIADLAEFDRRKLYLRARWPARIHSRTCRPRFAS